MQTQKQKQKIAIDNNITTTTQTASRTGKLTCSERQRANKKIAREQTEGDIGRYRAQKSDRERERESKPEREREQIQSEGEGEQTRKQEHLGDTKNRENRN